MRPVNQLNRQAVEAWLETTVDKAANTRRKEFGAVRQFTQWLVLEGKLRRDPTVGMPKIPHPRRVVHTLTRAEVDAVWRVCEDERDRLLVSLMFVLGLRCRDASALSVEDWDRSTGILFVVGKAQHERELPVVSHVEAALVDYLKVLRRHSGPMFPSNSGRLKPATISGRLVALMWRAGVKKAPRDGKSGHALRRTAATETLDASNDIRATRDLLGHADLSSMEHYIARSDVKKIAAAVNSRFGRDVA